MSSYPNSIKTFTTKIDNIDVIQAAHVNDIQAEITAIEAELGTLPKGSYATVKDRLDILTGLLTGWISDSDTWVYVSATQLKIVGKDVRGRFPVGTKLRLTQGTVKYFYAIAAGMSGSDTLITITGGSDYALVDAAITSQAYSYAASPQGFPSVFTYTPVAVGLTSPIYAEQTGKFVINGNTLSSWGRLDITSWSGQSGTLLWTMPVPSSSSIGGVSIGSASYYRAATDPQQGPKIIYLYTVDQARMFNNEGSGAVQWNTSSRVLIIWSASYPIG